MRDRRQRDIPKSSQLGAFEEPPWRGKNYGLFDHLSWQQSTSQTTTNEFWTPPRRIRYFVNLSDLGRLAEVSLTERARLYIEDASNDKVTARLNLECFQRILACHPCWGQESLSIYLLIYWVRLTLPLLNASASLYMMVHPDVEIVLAKGLAKYGTTIIIPSMTYSVSEILDFAGRAHSLWRWPIGWRGPAACSEAKSASWRWQGSVSYARRFWLYSKINQQRGLNQGIVDAERLGTWSIHVKIAIFNSTWVFLLRYPNSKFAYRDKCPGRSGITLTS